MPFQEESAHLTWEVGYEGGITVKEGQVRYDQLKREGLKWFGLYRSDGTAAVKFQLSPDKALFYRMRVNLHFNGKSERIYLAGYRKSDGTLFLSLTNPKGQTVNFNNWKDAGIDTIEFWNEEQVK